MNEILIISAEPRLARAVKEVLGSDGSNVVTVDRWAQGQALLFKDRFDIVCLDYECLKLEALDAFITIDNIFQKERTVGVLLVRKKSERSRQLETQLRSLGTTIDMSLGKERFVAELERIKTLVPEMKLGDEISVEIDNIVSLEKNLPSVDSGRLTKVPFARLLYALRVRKETGVLTVKAGGREGKIGFLRGEICEAPGLMPRNEVLAIFEWVGGEYAFQRKEVNGKTVDTFSLILAGVRRVPHQALADAMQGVTGQYAVPTNLWEDRQEKLSDFSALNALIRLCDGATTLDGVIGRLGSMSHEGFKAAYYAIQTDVLHLHDSSTAAGAIITYSREIRQQREKMDADNVKQTKAFRATTEDRSELEKELNQQLVFMRNASIHDVFGVWEGCGRKVVQERFYVLVKETHPDVYGGNVTGGVKALAQEIFIKIKETYQQLIRIERDQKVPPPDGWGDSEDGLEEPSEVTFKDARRPQHDTPVQPSRRNTPAPPKRDVQNTPVRTTITKPAPVPTPDRPRQPTPAPERKVDVASKISKLSGFQKRKARASRRRSKSDPGDRRVQDLVDPKLEEFDSVPSEAEISEAKAVEAAAEAAATEDVRKKRLQEMAARNKDRAGATVADPARDAFNEGIREYREGNYAEAYKHIKKAHDLSSKNDPQWGLYLTFFGYLMYKEEPHRIDEAEDIVRAALQTGHRAAMPDACLFWGHILKARGQTDKAVKQYERALRLNPMCTDAEREIRLAKIRDKRSTSEPGTFIKNLFKK